MKLPPRTQNAVCHAGRPRRLSRPTTSMCALPTLSTPNLTSYSSFSPTLNGTLACLTVVATAGAVGVPAGADWAWVFPTLAVASIASPRMGYLTQHPPPTPGRGLDD